MYAFGYVRPPREARLQGFAAGRSKVERVRMLGSDARLSFRQEAGALVVDLPAGASDAALPYALRIEGSITLGS